MEVIMKNTLAKLNIAKCSIALLGLFLVTMMPGSVNIGDKVFTTVPEAQAMDDKGYYFLIECSEYCENAGLTPGSPAYQACVQVCVAGRDNE